MKTILFILAVQWAASALAHTSTNDTANGHAASGIIKEHFDYLNAVAEATRRSQTDLLEFAWKVGAVGAVAVAAVGLFFSWLGFSTKREVKADLKSQATAELEAAKLQWKQAVDEEIGRNAARFHQWEIQMNARLLNLDEKTRQCQDSTTDARNLIVQMDARLLKLDEETRECQDSTKDARNLIETIKYERTVDKLVNDLYDALRGVDEDDSEPTRIAQTSKLQVEVKKRPGEPRLAIALAHAICRDQSLAIGERLTKAISTLQTTLRSHEKHASTADAEQEDKLTERMADVRYNLACYLNAYADRCLQGDEFSDERMQRKVSALKELNHSCLLFPGNVEPAKRDRQLQTLINGRDWDGNRWSKGPLEEPNPDC